MDMAKVGQVLEDAKILARKYYDLTGKPLGITGEVAEFSAAMILGLDLADARQDGYDAIRRDSDGETTIQIKGRRFHPLDANPGQRIGGINLEKEWDAVVLVLMDETFDVYSIYEAGRAEIEEAIKAPGSKARNERGALSAEKFKDIGRLVWYPCIRADDGELLAKLCLRSKRWFPVKDENGESAFARKERNPDGLDNVSKSAALMWKNANKDEKQAKRELVDFLVYNEVSKDERLRRVAEVESVKSNALNNFKQGFATKEECLAELHRRGYKTAL